MHIRNFFHVMAPFALRMACSDFGYRSAIVGSAITAFALLEQSKSDSLYRYNKITIPIRHNLISAFFYNGIAHIILDDHVRFGVSNAAATLFLDKFDGYKKRDDRQLIRECSVSLLYAFMEYQGYHLMLGNGIIGKFIMYTSFRIIPTFMFADEVDNMRDRKTIFYFMYMSAKSVLKDCCHNNFLPMSSPSPIREVLPDVLIKRCEKFIDPYIAEFTFSSQVMR